VTRTQADKRAQKTRGALLAAFFDLVLESRYEDIRIDEILERSGVGRSTFYEHFAGKDGLLAVSIEGPFRVLADAIASRDNSDDLAALLEHFWSNRAIARIILGGNLRLKTTTVLVRLIEARMKRDNVRLGERWMIPRRLVAIQLAEALLAPVAAWLTGEGPCEPRQMANALRTTARAIITAQGGSS
jgi:AcrR family transcriptional regulator